MKNNKILPHIVSVLFVLSLYTVFFVFSQAWAGEEEKEVIVDGSAPIFGKNIEGARNKAIKDALRNAVEQGVGTLMDADSIL
ncbi:MAG: hypothetical protein J7K84_11145 [Deltaproteobacteria bacterium]|nr:hypothetical protein [Deltaproteobacteria bacterium]